MIGGSRNWDYRYAWIRDAAFSVYALRRIGFSQEADRFLGWVLDAVERGGAPKVLYDLDGQQPRPERIDPELEGYRRSAPVRWGNAAVEQLQHDVYGEILDCAYQWGAHGGAIDSVLWQRLRTLAEGSRLACGRTGSWHLGGSHNGQAVYLFCGALPGGAGSGRAPGRALQPAGKRQSLASGINQIRNAILNEAWDESLQSLTEHLGGGKLDASLLSLPIRRVIPATHPRMVATASAIASGLESAGKGLLYRYLPEESPDGLPGHDGAFLLCSFWLVDNLAHQGRLDEALALYGSPCARTGSLGLLPEEIDPGSGAFLGNYPQAFSHIGVISSGVHLCSTDEESDCGRCGGLHRASIKRLLAAKMCAPSKHSLQEEQCTR